MRLPIAVFLLASLIIFPSFQEKEEGEIMPWSATDRPVWKDYKKSLQGNAIEAAYSVCGINMSSQPREVGDTIYLEIYSFFSKTLSAKSSEKELLTNEVLAHELGHFDLTECYARMLRKELTDTSFKNTEEFYKTVQAMYNKENQACKDVQDRYDRATNHSMNQKAQEKWTKQIADMLEKYSAYTNKQLKIVIKSQ